MNAVWNLPILERPPYTTWRITPLNAKKKGVDVTRYKTALGIAIHDLESMGNLHQEATVLSRLIYRMKSKFRNDKGLRFMVKLNKALINYYNIFLLKDYQALRSDLQMDDGMYILPSRQRLEYVLARTQGFAKLMARIEEIARYTANFLKARIELGHAWSIAIIAYGNISRIWFCSRSTLRKCCKWYNELYQCAEQFEYIGAVWFPRYQHLPHDIKSWLSLDWLHTEINSQTNSQNWQKIFGRLPSETCNETAQTGFIAHNDKTDILRLIQVTSTNNALEDKPTSNTDINDIGEVIDRETFNRSLPTNNTNNTSTTKRKHSDERKTPKDTKMKKKKKN